MNLEETTALLAFVSQIMPAQRIDEFTPDAWAVVLDDVSYDDAYAAVVKIAKRAPFVAPVEIIAEVKRTRRDRLEQMRPEESIPDADPDNPRAYVRALRAGRTRAADGLKPRDVGALIGQVAGSLPALPSGR